MELGVSGTRVATLRKVAILLEAAASRTRGLAQSLAGSGVSASPGDPLAAALAGLADEIEGALEAISSALLAAREPAPFGAALKAALLRVESLLGQQGGDGAQPAEWVRLAGVQRDLVALLGTLASALDARESPTEARGGRLSTLHWPRPDPFRVQLGLRAGIAVCAALLLPMSLGWSLNTTVAPIAFMVASIPTRGAAAQTVSLLALVVGSGWLLADLSIVFAGPVLDRMPLSLVPIAAVAGFMGFLSVKRPRLEMFRSIGLLLAFLPVVGGAAPPTDVYGAYSTTTYVGLAVLVGWAATHLFWPAAAGSLFAARAADQLELCGSMLAAEPGDLERRSRAADALRRYTAQLESTTTLHAQAANETVERGLDTSRRLTLLALIQDLFDAVLASYRAGAHEAQEHGGGPENSELAEALAREREVFTASLESAILTMRGGGSLPTRDLAEAHAAVTALRARLRAAADVPDVERALLERVDARDQIVTRQLALEDWLSDWVALAAGGVSPASLPDSGAQDARALQ
jgi:hypothetical protein